MNKSEVFNRWFTPSVVVLVIVEVLLRLAESGQRAGLSSPEFWMQAVLLTLQAAAVVAAVALRGRKLGWAGVVGFGGSVVLDLVSAIFGAAGPSLVTAMFLLLLPFLAGKRGTIRQCIVVVVSMLLAACASVFFGAGPTWEQLVEFFGGAVVLLLIFAAGLIVRFRRSSKVHLTSSLRSQERETLARDLHDTVAHRVSAMLVQAQAGQTLLAGGSTEGALTALETIESEGNKALAEMREVVSTLRDSASNSRWSLATLTDDSSLPPVRVTQIGDVSSCSVEVQKVLYRVAQEAVTNARRHAHGASKIVVRVDYSANQVRLTVEDDGKSKDQSSGESNASGDGFGLQGMRERAQTLGGQLSAGPIAGSSPVAGGGWRVELTVPRG